MEFEKIMMGRTELSICIAILTVFACIPIKENLVTSNENSKVT